MLMQSEIYKLEVKFGIRILPVKIIGGRRWSFIGNTTGEIPAGESKRIQIDEYTGVIVYNWHTLNDSQKSIVENNLKNKVE
jgi:hypothetical protein